MLLGSSRNRSRDMLTCAAQCQVAKKAKKEMLPSTRLYSDRSRASDATHEVQREHEYKDASDPDTIVPPEERQKSFKVHHNAQRGRSHMLLYSCRGAWLHLFLTC